MIDLHTHSTASDGTLTPTELVLAANDLKLCAVALTDHDTIGGIEEACSAAAPCPLTFVPGVEISASVDKGALHIVGLFIDHKNGPLIRVLDEAVKRRRVRNEKVVRRLAELGTPVEMAELRQEAGEGVLGKPHFARVMVKKGYVKNVRAAFRNYLARGGTAYFPKQRMDRREAVAIIREAGGVPVLAHPDQTYLKGDQLDDLVRELTDCGLGAIETRCSGYSASDIRQYRMLAEKYGLAESGGSDFHGGVKSGIALGTGPGKLRVPDEFLLPLKDRAEKIRADK